MQRLLIALLIPFFAITTIVSPAVGQHDKLSQPLKSALQRVSGADTEIVWIFFRDKGPRPAEKLVEAQSSLSSRALARRALRADAPTLIGFEDIPLVREYVDSVARFVVRLRHESRWFNAVSAEATAEQIKIIERLPFVDRIDLVRRYHRAKEPPTPIDEAMPTDQAQSTLQPAAAFELNYGSSFGQLNQINVPPVHALGLNGDGVIVAMFDAGFNNLAHVVFRSLKVIATHDFVNGGEDVGDARGRMGEGSHGTATLSCIAGFDEGQLVGPAFGARFILAKTENTESETPVEEDNWAAAAEWVEGQGADVISSSLGYFDFDPPFPSYTYRDMDGMTAISTKAADLAASRGVVVVNSAGNEGNIKAPNTLSAPADGKKVIAVGALTPMATRAIFSSYGPSFDGRIKPDLMAQGVNVKVASSRSQAGYSSLNGTSFSCPLTAGVAALVLQAHPAYTVAQVISVLHATASNAVQPDNLMGWGTVNAFAAVQSLPSNR